MQNNYVLGFLYNDDASKIALIRKNKPKWQEGKLNAIGGKIELGETPHQAMVREFTEETGWTGNTYWEPCVILTDPKFIYSVYCFRIFSDYLIDRVETNTEEEIIIINRDEIYNYLAVHNLYYLIPMLAHNGIVFPITIMSKD